MLLPATSALAEPQADKAIAQRIGRELEQSGQLRNYRIGVKYENGTAWLLGNVTDANQRDAAIRLASAVEGVSRVESKLQVGSGNQPGGENQTRSIRSEFNQAKVESQQAAQREVVQAYGENARRMPQPQERMARGPGRMQPQARGPRSNMPVPANPNRISAMPVRQAAMNSGVYQAGGACAGCGPGGPMAGPMGGPMGGGMAGPMGGGGGMGAVPVGFVHHGSGRGPSYENAQMPGYAWPSYASYPNYAALTYPKQYSPTAWPYIGPFYPYPQVPLAWRKVSLEWDDGWWFLDFSAHNSSH
jgi:hypothetical protein